MDAPPARPYNVTPTEVRMAWLILALAGVCEIVWAATLKRYGFTLTRGGAFTVAVLALSMVLLARAMKELPLGTAYVVWTGIGAVGTATYGIFFLNESADWKRLLCISLVVTGVVGLKVLSPSA